MSQSRREVSQTDLEAFIAGGLVTRRSLLKKGAAVGGTLALGPLIAACGGGGSSSTTGFPKVTSGAIKGTGEVMIGTFQDPAIDTWKADVLPQFEKETGIKPVILQDQYSTFFEKAFNDAKSGAGQYDIYLMDDPWVPQFGAAKALVNLSELGFQPSSTYAKPFLDLGFWPPRQGPRVKGFEDATPQLVGLPFLGDLEINSYRKDVYPNGVPTWDGFVQQAKGALDASSNTYPIVFRGVAGNPIIAGWDPIFRSFGGVWFDDSWNPTFNNADGKAAADFLVDTLKPLAPPGVAEFDTDQVTAALENGHALMAVQYSGAIKDMLAKADVRKEFAFSIVPKKKFSIAQIGIWVSGIAPGAPNQENAVKFMQWSVLPSTQTQIARANIIPVTIPAFKDPQANRSDPVLKVWLQQLQTGAEARPRTPDWAKIEDLAGTALNGALVDGKGGGDALDNAADQVKSYLTQQGYYS